MIKSNMKGRLYETKCHSFFKENSPSSLSVFDQAGGHGIDIPFQHSKHPVILGMEVKKSAGDTMGGTSLRFQNDCLSGIPLSPIIGFETVFPDIEARVTEHIKNYIIRANELITERNMRSPDKYELITGFPAKIPVDVRKQCVKEGFQRKIQSFYTFSIESWKAFYRNKGNSYIQIGDKGIFHLGENPLSLPVPEIKGSMSLEVRLYAAGSNGKPFAKVEIAVKFKGLVCDKSPYTLDNKDHIIKLFG